VPECSRSVARAVFFESVQALQVADALQRNMCMCACACVWVGGCMCGCMCVCACVCVCVGACVCFACVMGVCVHVCVRVCSRSIHPSIHPSIRSSIYAYISDHGCAATQHMTVHHTATWGTQQLNATTRVRTSTTEGPHTCMRSSRKLRRKSRSKPGQTAFPALEMQRKARGTLQQTINLQHTTHAGAPNANGSRYAPLRFLPG
jgi:hypothetical protein